jgi:glyoxylase-like metal-dependent hydrolase (beta-lactamase superfamily II)
VTREEQEPASSEVAEVGPNVLRLQVPIRFTGLGHVNCYVLLDERGAAVVDAGMPGQATWRAIEEGLSQAGLEVADVHTVLVTHSHPDHYGSAGRLAHEAGADLVAEKGFRTWLEPRSKRPPADDTGYLPSPRGTLPWGGPPSPELRRHIFMSRLARWHLRPHLRPPIPNRRVAGGDQLALAGREWTALHTPGHTGDHLCLYDPEGGLLISGDHVLPTITPHVPGLSPLADPLGSYLASLEALGSIGEVKLVLPAHGHPFTDLPGRVAAIAGHHAERLEELRRIGAALGRASVADFSRELFRRHLWGMMAESETFAHLEYLRLRGGAERVREKGVLRYEVCPA